jgi:hypothetical protein
MPDRELYPSGTQVAFFAKDHPRNRRVCKVLESALVQKGKNKYYKYVLEDPADGKQFKAEDGEDGVRIEKVLASKGTVLYKSPEKVMIIAGQRPFSLSPTAFTQEELDTLNEDTPVEVIHTEFLPRFVAFRVI